MAKKGANRKSRSGPPPPLKRGTIAAVTSRSTTISELPDDITYKILLRISDIKSLVRCKKVCKTWRNLILQPYFAKSHLSRGSLPLSLILYRPVHFGILELNDDLASLSCQNATIKFRSKIYTGYKWDGRFIVGACNGLVCLPLYNNVAVCNPILPGRNFVLPKLPKLANALISVKFGFGFSPSSDEYKVLAYTLTYENHLYNMKLDIFTLGRDYTWRSIRGHSRQTFERFSTGIVFVNGALHWVGWDVAPKFLYYVDVEKEELEILSLPCCIVGLPYLGILDDFLYLSNLNPSRPSSHANVWVMKADCIQTGAWTLKWVVNLQCLNVVYGPVRPIKVLKDGTVLLIFHDKFLGSHNPQTGVTERITYDGSQFWLESIAHTPSFLCPPWLK